MKKILACAAALTLCAASPALAGYPLPVSSSPYRGTQQAAQPLAEASAPAQADQWNVPNELSAKGGAQDTNGHKNFYKSAESDADQWNVPKEFGK